MGEMTWPTLMSRVTQLEPMPTADGLLAVATSLGVPAWSLLANRKDLIPQAAAMLGIE
jgi:hypothetical protein